MRRFFVIALITAVVIGCSPRHYKPIEIVHISDTVVRDRIIHDSVAFEVPVEVERIVTFSDSSHLENRWAKSDAVVDTLGKLHHSLESIPQRIYVPYNVEVHDTTVVKQDSEVIYQEVERQLSKWQSFSMVLGWILGALLLIGIVGGVALWFIKHKII